MEEREVLRCQIHEWYPHFRRVSLRTKFHVLPQAFVDYLLRDDGLFVASDSEALPKRTKVTCPQLQSEDYEHWSEEDDEDQEPDVPRFVELEEAVKASIAELGGAVFPKLNWSAPKDTTWLATSGNLRCTNFDEISLLLTASDSVTYDLLHAFDSCTDQGKVKPDTVILALRKWYDLRPELEFRAFVYRGFLVGISQREVTGFYPSLLEKLDDYEELIFDFFVEEVREKFRSLDFTFDCYITRDGRVKLIDFNTWKGSTLPLLFTWEELEQQYEKLRGEMSGFNPVVECLNEEMLRVRLTEAPLPMKEGDMGSSNGGNYTHEMDQTSSSPNAERLAISDVDYRVPFKIVSSEGLVQPGLKIATGIPIDLVDKRNWEDLVRNEVAEDSDANDVFAVD